MNTMKSTFGDLQRVHQIMWRKTHISSDEWGYQHGKFKKNGEPNKPYEHIVPRKLWRQTLWSGIRAELPAYLGTTIQAHAGTHNLMSSWVVCANLYFPVRIYPEFAELMTGFLKQRICDDIVDVTDVELEFAFGDELHPANLLGEKDGTRGSGQTSPDVAFKVTTSHGNGIILTECKYTEHSFYPCSARTVEDSRNKPHNPDPSRCMVQANGCNYYDICHQKVWERRYWDHLRLSLNGRAMLRFCPAASAGYQLFRQQALAEGISKSGRYTLVASTVAFDERNKGLVGCLRNTGVPDFQSDWGKLFEGHAVFKTWTHQEWVNFVRVNKGNQDWLRYVKDRYGY